MCHSLLSNPRLRYLSYYPLLCTTLPSSLLLSPFLPLSSSQHLSEEVVHQIIGEAVEVEKAFICDALPVSLIGMNSDLMREYIEYCADRLVTN